MNTNSQIVKTIYPELLYYRSCNQPLSGNSAFSNPRMFESQEQQHPTSLQEQHNRIWNTSQESLNRIWATDYETLSRIPIHRRDILQALVKVHASELSLEDTFMTYKPKYRRDASLKKILTTIISQGIPDFWHPKYDPSIINGNICFVPDEKPAVYHSFNWWKKQFENIGLQIGTRKQYIAFLGCLIKELVRIGVPVEDAWYKVCINSKDLGNFIKSNRLCEMLKAELGLTGRIEVCGFYDLGNTCKMLGEDHIYIEEDYCYNSYEGFYLAGGGYLSVPCLASIDYLDYPDDDDFCQSVGWPVLTRYNFLSMH